MPASAVASRTPWIAGMSGTFVGARGETVVLICNGSMNDVLNVPQTKWPGQARPSRMLTCIDRLLFRYGRLVVVRAFDLVELLDLGPFAKLVPQFGPRFASHEALDLRLHVGIGPRRLLPLVLDLD